MIYAVPIPIYFFAGAVGATVSLGMSVSYIVDAISNYPLTPYRAIFGVSEAVAESAAEGSEIKTKEKNYKCKIGSGEAFDCTLQKPDLTSITQASIMAFFRGPQEGSNSPYITWAINKKDILKKKDNIYKITAKEEDLSGWDGNNATIEVINKSRKDKSKKYASIKPLFSTIDKNGKISAEGETEYFVGQAKTGLTITKGGAHSCVFKTEEEAQSCSLSGALIGELTVPIDASQKEAESTLDGLYFEGLSNNALTQIEESKHYIIKMEGKKRDILTIPESITFKKYGTSETDKVTFEKIRTIMLGGNNKFMFVF